MPLLCLLTVLAALPLAAHPAHAGSYVLSATDANGNPSVDSNGDPSPTGGELDNTAGIATVKYDVTYGGYGAGASNHCGMSLSGTITSTYTWKPDDGKTLAQDPAPTEAIVHQHCHVYAWSSSNTDTLPAATADNGLGSTAVPEHDDYGNTKSNSSDCTGDKYAVVMGGMTVTVPSCTPAGSADGSQNTGELVVIYTDDVIALVINPVGAQQDSSANWDILIGQKCAPVVVVAGNLGGLTITSYSWSVRGTTFQTWSNETPAIPATGTSPAVPANPNASYELDGPGPVNIAAPSWYWNNPGPGATPETITCSVTLTPPAGSGSACSLSPTKSVVVYVPPFTATAYAGNVQVNASDPTAINGAYELWAGPTSSLPLGYPAGMNWSSTVTTPQTPVAFGNGQLEYVQTWSPNYSYTGMGITHQFPAPGAPTTGLDSAYPYVAAYSENPAMDYFSDDAPDIALTDSVTYASLVGSFKIYLLYMPPGSNSTWVPLANKPWSVSGMATRPSSGHWSDYGTGAAGTVTGSGAFTTDNTFPSWVNIVAGGTF